MDRSKIEQNLKSLRERIARAETSAGRIKGSVRLVAVTKFQPVEAIQALYSLGVQDIGESRMQEALRKKESLLGCDIVWHFIGSLQRNKASLAAREFDFIHSVDSFSLAESLNAQALQKPLSVLVQVNPLNESTKHGVGLHELEPLLEKLSSLSSIKVCGLMAMAPVRGTLFFHDVETSFSLTQQAFHSMKERFSSSLPHFCELSMGMSQDFEEAIGYGSTMVRIGSLLFDGTSS